MPNSSLPYPHFASPPPHQSSRSNREEVAKLLEENAALHSRLAAKSMDQMAPGGGSPSHPAGPRSAKLFETSSGSSGWVTGCVIGVVGVGDGLCHRGRRGVCLLLSD